MFEIADTQSLNPRLVNLLKPNSPDADSYQRLRLSVENRRQHKDALVVAITSPASSEGKTLTAINLAAALAQNPAQTVLLIDLNLRATDNSVKDYLGLHKWKAPGVVDHVLNKSVDWEQLANCVPALSLHFMPAGQHTKSPYEILNSAQLGDMIAEARRRYHFVIVDTAAVTLFADTQLIAPWIDKFIVLVAADDTSRRQLAACLDLMPPDKVMGLVINGCKKSESENHAV